MKREREHVKGSIKYHQTVVVKQKPRKGANQVAEKMMHDSELFLKTLPGLSK